jgi:RimJ/RimL family protein N-acetyltransferase/predicted ester cyclase
MTWQEEVPTLTTPDLILRPLRESDAPALFAFTSDPEVTRYVLWPTHRDLSQTQQFIRRLTAPSVRSWAIVHRIDATVIGVTFVHSFHPVHHKGEIAFPLAKPYWGRGYATQAAHAVLRHAFANWALHRIEGTCMLANVASARVLEKLGMTCEGVMRQSHRRDDGFVDMKLYAVLREEFEGERCSVSASAVSRSSVQMPDHRRIIQAFYEDIWNKHDKTKIPALLHEAFTFRGSLGQLHQGHNGFASYVDFVHAALGDYRCVIQDIISEGNQAFARMLFSGVHRADFFGYAPTFKRVEWAGAAVFTFDGDKISDLWVLGDMHGLLQQLARNVDT